MSIPILISTILALTIALAFGIAVIMIPEDKREQLDKLN